ncbi:hypothetical protein PITC_008650 [Penicillium italicum]|uniref:Uncharacterized protein n=1 Tax=Penicillium italicum TaxID=40296 RepID=A0A0A2L5A5_PENIT|nr:hypothetical protein PITC_008650 [Penicillium italicum]
MVDSARSPVDDHNDKTILTWTEFQVPKDLELDTEWSGYFEPLARASGNAGSAMGESLESQGIYGLAFRPALLGESSE